MKNCKVRLDFTELKEIGQEGRNSKVFLAHDNQLDGEIVVKEIAKNPSMHHDEYFKEARLLYAHNHNNIVKVNYACEDDDNIYVAMPFYKNGSLKKRISNGNYLTVREAVRYSIQFLSGLNHIHSKGLIHFDIKPDNILISDSNEAMLSDFGLALYTNVYGFCKSKAAYTPHVTPEQLYDLQQTIKNDIYQAGVTMYRMVNGNELLYQQIPNTGDDLKTGQMLAEAIVKGKFPDRKLYLPHVPKKFKKIIKKCIEPDPNDRYDNTLQIINELASIDENLDIRYGRDASCEFWEAPKNGYMYKVCLNSKADKFDIKVYKTKDGKTTNCTSQCSNNIDKTQVISKLETIFASL
ncbi:serine/threonine-protein kinase [uncultured Parabacteroides sp.]|jgi:serine/threonine protein kinase|uniref:serine/threonine-protein kinase n=1 Tax=uncultured Parabacteroides sp. TaxID=512312 RepID=UPI0025E4C227|nr:serine/threonine-protein kinase [uncultured Parabacteroides sp.]